MDNEHVKPELAGGFRDYLPSDMIARQDMIAIIRKTFEVFGFDPLDTPAMEREDVLTGNRSDFGMIIYRALSTGKHAIHDDPSTQNEIALRFDLTVPLARVVAAYPQLRRPFKRYQMGNLWRGEKPQAGRFREFMQCDADIVGSATMTADAEIIALMITTMRALGVERFAVHFNNRKILNGLALYAGFSAEQTPQVLRVIDKIHKIGLDGVMRELTKPVSSEQRDEVFVEGSDRIESRFGVGCTQDVAKKIQTFLTLSGTTDEVLERVRELFGDNKMSAQGIQDMREVIATLRAMNVPQDYWQYDLSIVRGLGYYTGPVFETFLQEYPEIGSVFSGGRYDDLVSRFSDANIPATGASIGVDRLFVALQHLGIVSTTSTRVQVLVTVMDSEAMSEYLRLVTMIRDAGIRTMLWLGEDPAFKAQMAYAVAQEIPIVIIAGEDERAKHVVSIKDMRKRTQVQVAESECVATIDRILHIDITL